MINEETSPRQASGWQSWDWPIFWSRDLSPVPHYCLQVQGMGVAPFPPCWREPAGSTEHQGSEGKRGKRHLCSVCYVLCPLPGALYSLPPLSSQLPWDLGTVVYGNILFLGQGTEAQRSEVTLPRNYCQSKIERGSGPGDQLAPRGDGKKGTWAGPLSSQVGPELPLAYGARRP